MWRYSQYYSANGVKLVWVVMSITISKSKSLRGWQNQVVGIIKSLLMSSGTGSESAKGAFGKGRNLGQIFFKNNLVSR